MTSLRSVRSAWRRTRQGTAGEVRQTEEQVERDERMAESETEPDGLTGRVHYGLHLDQPDEEMISVSIRVPKSTSYRNGQALPHQPQRIHAPQARRARGLNRETGNERRQVTQEPAPKILGASGLVTVRRSCVGACPSSRVPAPYRS